MCASERVSVLFYHQISLVASQNNNARPCLKIARRGNLSCKLTVVGRKVWTNLAMSRDTCILPDDGRCERIVADEVGCRKLQMQPYVQVYMSVFWLLASHCQGYKNRSNFLKFGENWWNWTGLNFKTVEFTVHCFKISEKGKSQQKNM
jgi:hypothetical protein